MILFPAIDLKDGACVRLYKGDIAKATLFSKDPSAQAKSFENQGAEWVHIVDLNGAFEGKPTNINSVKDILRNISIPVQLGGGIRNIKTIEIWLESGVRRVILGTAALKNPDLVKEACKKFPGKIAVGIDARNGFVAVEGWAEQSEIKAIELTKKFGDVGVSAIIYTDIERDGAMEGPNIDETKLLAQSTSIPVIASGGISGIDDIKKIKTLEPYGVIGVISGRAIYDGKIDIREAISILN